MIAAGGDNFQQADIAPLFRDENNGISQNAQD